VHLTRSLCLGIHLSDVCEKVQDSSRVAPLVIVPGHHLDKVVVQSNARLDVNYGGVVIAVQVGRDNVVMGDGQNACSGLVKRGDGIAGKSVHL
jgi:hypothetical protein